MYIFPLLFFLGALYSGQSFCIYMGCTDIGYCIYDICGFLWMVLVFFYGYVHGYVYGCVYGCMWVCVWGMCLGYVYGYRVSILREAWFNKYRGLPLLGARFHHHWDLLASRGPFEWDLLLHEFFQFFSTKMEKFAPVCNVKQIFLAS
jgi:hypothetical protein